MQHSSCATVQVQQSLKVQAQLVINIFTFTLSVKALLSTESCVDYLFLPIGMTGQMILVKETGIILSLLMMMLQILMLLLVEYLR